MSRMQKFAWFNLSVVALVIVIFAGLVPVLGWHRAHGAMGFTGLMGFGALFLRRKAGEVIMDERDTSILQRSLSASYGVFWWAFVAVAVGVAPAVYGWEGQVPVSIVQTSVFWAMILVQCTLSTAILAQYAKGSGHAE